MLCSYRNRAHRFDVSQQSLNASALSVCRNLRQYGCAYSSLTVSVFVFCISFFTYLFFCMCCSCNLGSAASHVHAHVTSVSPCLLCVFLTLLCSAESTLSMMLTLAPEGKYAVVANLLPSLWDTRTSSGLYYVTLSSKLS